MEDCDLLIERFSLELSVVKDQLAVLTQGVDVRVEHLALSDPASDLQLAFLHTSSLTALTRTSTNLKKPIRRNAKRPQVSNSSALATPTCLTLKELLQRVDQRECKREELNKKYLNMMKCHIEKQLKELKARGAMLTKARERRRRKEKVLKLKLKPPRFISTGADNKEYLANVYQSVLYQAVDLEFNLKKSGKLQTSAEIKAFWNSLLKLDCHPKREYTTATQEAKCQPLPSMEEVGEGEEGYTNSWAITAQPPESKETCSRKMEDTSRSLDLIAEKFITALIIKIKVPDLETLKSSLQEILGPPIKNIQQRRGSAKWESDLWQKRREVQRAYQQSKANELAMRTRFYQFLQDIEASPVSPEASLTPTQLPNGAEHMSLCQPTTPPPTTPPLAPTTPPQPLEVSVEHIFTGPQQVPGAGRSGGREDGDTRCIMEGADGRGVGQGKERGRACPNNQQKTCTVKQTFIPLNMSTLMKTNKVLESKKKFWNNYLLA